MKQTTAAQFAVKCLALIDEVSATGEPIVVIKDGKPLVKLVGAEAKNDSIFGYMAGKAKIVGDIVSPVTAIEEWDALK